MMLEVLCLSLIVAFMQSSLGAIPVENELGFLVKYGYLKKGSNISLASPQTIDALKKAQAFGNIPQTGELDEQTLNYFRTPRCNFPDFNRNRYNRRWYKNVLTYGISKMTTKLAKTDVLHEMEKALEQWGVYSGHYFYYQPSHFHGKKPDISLGFYRGYHGDGRPFDRKGLSVAHAFPPPKAQVHLNDDATFAMHPTYEYGVTVLHPLMLHLMGHVMGLGHSSDRRAVMNPINYHHLDHLGSDDIAKIRKLYHGRGKPTWPTRSKKTTDFPPRPDGCDACPQ